MRSRLVTAFLWNGQGLLKPAVWLSSQLRVLALGLMVSTSLWAQGVTPGIDNLFIEHRALLKGKRVGLLSTQIALDGKNEPSYQRLKRESKKGDFTLVALFAPEHGFWGGAHADEKVEEERDETGLVIYTLYGANRHPTLEQLAHIDLLLIDLQDVGVRCYTYASSAFYAMESCAKAGIPVLILDRPNPINGLVVDGPCLEPSLRSFVGYIDIPFCHGMTMAEMAHYFNQEYKIGCQLTLIPMKGWKRAMSYRDTGLTWLGSSPQIPDVDTPLYYVMTNLLGQLNWFSCGVGYTQPFRLVAHPDTDAHQLKRRLDEYHLPGVNFYPAYYKPFSGSHKLKICKGVRILVTNPAIYRPFQTQMAFFEVLRRLYPKSYKAHLRKMNKTQELMLDNLFGIKEVRKLLEESKDIWKAMEKRQLVQLNEFRRKRLIYLIADYQ